ncbi:transposase [Streptomyces sp. NPDC053474]|uniref:transposase n=1 Tax=Streptomyces sp. NPDC053474 TaxID=3365704 RepID=UPI0037CE3272
MAKSARTPGGGGAGGEGLGRSRGGFTTKPHLSADGRCRPLSLIVTPGQRADCTQFKPVLEKIRVPKLGPGRPRTKPDSVAADKAYSNGPCRAHLRRPRIRHTIPEKTDSRAARLRKGSHGGRHGRFRRGAIRETQHRRTSCQSVEAAQGGGHPLRQAPLRLPRHRHCGSPRGLAPNMIDRRASRRRPPCSGRRSAASGRRLASR